MAVSNSGMVLYTDNDNEGGWGGMDGPDDYDNAIQGANSESWQVSKNSTETGTLTKTANMGTAKYFTFYMSSNLAPYYTDVKLNVRTGTSDYEQWTIATSTDRKVSGDFHPIVAEFGQGAETGTFDKTSIASIQVILNNSSSGNIRSVINNWIDTMWYGTGRTIGGTTAGDSLFMESHVLDTDTNDNYDGCSELYKGALTYQTDVKVDTTTGNSYGETVIFAAGYNTSDNYTILVTGTADFQASNYLGGDSNVTVNLDTSGAASWQMLGGSIVAKGATVFASGQDIKGAVFSNRTSLTHGGSNFENNVINTSGVMTVTSGGTFAGNTFNRSTGATGVDCTNLGDLDDTIFVSDGTGYATTLTDEITADISMDWKNTESGYVTGSSGDDVGVTPTGDETILCNVSSGIFLTISVVAGSSIPSVANSGPGTVKVVSGLVTLTLIGLPNGIEVRIRQGSYTIQHTQDVTGNQVSYNYTYVPNKKVTISFSGAGIIQSKTVDIILPAASQSSLITFGKDPSYQEYPGLDVVFSGVSNITDTDPHTITMTFSGEPKASTVILANISQQVEDNGTISDLGVTGDSKVWEFDFTADGGITDTTNFFRAGTSILDTNDRAINESDSANFEIDIGWTIPDAIHKWDMDGDSLDSGTIGGYDGTDNSITYSTTDAKFSQAAQFSGSAHMEHGFVSAVGDEQAISLYVVINVEDASPQFIFGLGEQVGLWTDDYAGSGASNMYFVCRNNNTSTDYSSRSTNTLTTGQVYHIGMNYKNGDFVTGLYINGVLQDNRHDNIAVGDIASYFGARAAFTSQMTGASDHIEIFDRHLTATEWQALSDRTSV